MSLLIPNSVKIKHWPHTVVRPNSFFIHKWTPGRRVVATTTTTCQRQDNNDRLPHMPSLILHWSRQELNLGRTYERPIYHCDHWGIAAQPPMHNALFCQYYHQLCQAVHILSCVYLSVSYQDYFTKLQMNFCEILQGGHLTNGNKQLYFGKQTHCESVIRKWCTATHQEFFCSVSCCHRPQRYVPSECFLLLTTSYRWRRLWSQILLEAKLRSNLGGKLFTPMCQAV